VRGMACNEACPVARIEGIDLHPTPQGLGDEVAAQGVGGDLPADLGVLLGEDPPWVRA
jgi:hypothetical protein